MIVIALVKQMLITNDFNLEINGYKDIFTCTLDLVFRSISIRLCVSYVTVFYF